MEPEMMTPAMFSYLDAILQAGVPLTSLQSVEMVNELGRGVGAPYLEFDEAEAVFDYVHGMEYEEYEPYQGEEQMIDTTTAREMINQVAEGEDPDALVQRIAFGEVKEPPKEEPTEPDEEEETTDTEEEPQA